MCWTPSADTIGTAQTPQQRYRGPHCNARGHAAPSLKSPPTRTTAPTLWYDVRGETMTGQTIVISTPAASFIDAVASRHSRHRNQTSSQVSRSSTLTRARRWDRRRCAAPHPFLEEPPFRPRPRADLVRYGELGSFARFVIRLAAATTCSTSCSVMGTAKWP